MSICNLGTVCKFFKKLLTVVKKIKNHDKSSTFDFNWTNFLKIAQILVKLGVHGCKIGYISFLAFLAISREKWVIFSRISREIKNARNVHVYSLPINGFFMCAFNCCNIIPIGWKSYSIKKVTNKKPHFLVIPS